MAPGAARPVDGLLIDLDGTVYVDETPIPGAVEALAALRRAGVPYRFITNTTRQPRVALAAKLDGMGIQTSLEQVLNAPWAAARWLRERGVRRVSALVAEAALAELEGFEIDHEKPQVVLVGDLGSAWSFEILDRAFRALLAGAELAALQRNRYWKVGGRLSLDAGPFVAALEYASGKSAHLVGKPSAAYFEAGIAALGFAPHRIAMVGDDLETDVGGGRAAGLTSVAVRTGKFRPENEEGAQRVGNAVLDSIADLPRWLGLS